MNDKEIFSKLLAIFREVFDDELLNITEEMGYGDLEEWDSLTHIRILLSVEKEFKFKFDIEDIGKLVTVGDIIRYIKENVNRGNES